MERDASTAASLPRAALILVPLCLVVLVVGTIIVVRAPRQGARAVTSAYLAPVVPGLHGRHPLNEREVGELLIGELACVSCHAQLEPLSSLSKAAPNLKDVAWRVAPEFLRRFIADPAAAQPGTTMPQVLTGMSHEEREEIADAITQFLVAQSGTPFYRDPVDERDIGAGRKLFHTVGCVACHAPREAAMLGAIVPEPRDGAVGLAHLPDKYSLESLSQFLHQPLRERPSGRMPDMGLNSAESKSIASYLLGAEYANIEPAPARRSLAEKGKEYFKAFNCVACHQLEGVKTLPPVVLGDRLDPMQGCLSPNPVRAPNFRLSDNQRDAMRAAMAAGAIAQSADEQIAMTLTAFNCIGCHVRDDYGGVSAAIDLYFKTSEPSLGNEARIPPPLTDAGAKLQSEWVHRVMFDSASVRPFMHTRMPQFGEAHLASLSSLLESADLDRPFEMETLSGDAARDAREAGRVLLGTDALGCIVCHNFNGKEAPSFKGIDLITSVERLRPGWFSRFLIDPQATRPGIVMPQGWLGGVAARTEILDGDTDAQVQAIWFYLSQGRTARDPKGIRSEPSILTVTDTTRTYRGRSSIAGFRGIAVGLPGGLSYAFNANTGSLAGMWRGGFVRVRWDGQGAGDFNPAGRAIALAQDVAFCRLDSDEAPWPLRPKMNEENPVNPDPLYPRNLGYRFNGYFFDDASVPTFMYRIGAVAIEDTSAANISNEHTSLVRTIAFSSPIAQTLYFRILTGEIEEVSPVRFKTASLQLTIPPVATLLRPLAGEDEQTELILKLEVPKGESTIVINYELLQ